MWVHFGMDLVDQVGAAKKWFVDLCSQAQLYAGYDVSAKDLTVCSAYRASTPHYPDYLSMGHGEHKIQSPINALQVLVAIFERGWCDAPEWRDTQELRSGSRSLASIFAGELIREFDHLGKHFYASSDNRFGSDPGDIQVGGNIVVFVGSSVPYILRPVGDGKSWTLVGWAYHYGVILGEAFQQDEVSSLLETFSMK